MGGVSEARAWEGTQGSHLLPREMAGRKNYVCGGREVRSPRVIFSLLCYLLVVNE